MSTELRKLKEHKPLKCGAAAAAPDPQPFISQSQPDEKKNVINLSIIQSTFLAPEHRVVDLLVDSNISAFYCLCTQNLLYFLHHNSVN